VSFIKEMRLAIAASLLPLAACSAVEPPPPRPVLSSAMAEGAGGVPLHYLDFGGRGDPVILLAGAGNTAWIYEEFGRELARSHRVLALTRRGHGESGSPATGYDRDTLAEDLRLFMDQRGIARAALAGHSLAGAEITRFATRYPERVTALVYLDAAYDRSTQLAMLEKDPVSEPPPTAADRASAAAFVDYLRRTRKDLARYWTPAVERDVRASVAARTDGTFGWRTSGPIFGALFSGAAAAPPDYSAIRAPALAIYSVEDEDHRLPADASRELRAALDAFEAGPLAAWRNASIGQFRRQMRDGTVVEMDAGHHLWLHRPRETLDLVRGFLARHARRQK
jgi:pimeloyl-ACP methyl ester carboxylesterase